MLFVFLCLTLLCMTISRHIHAPVTSFHSFYGYLIFHCINVLFLFILCSVDGDLDCFHVLAIVNNTTMNIGVYISFQITVFSGYMPMSGIAGSYGSAIFTLSGIFILLSIMVESMYFPTKSVRGFPFLHNLSSLVFIICILFGPSDHCEMIFHCSFDLISLITYDIEHFFMYFLVIWISSLEKLSL